MDHQCRIGTQEDCGDLCRQRVHIKGSNVSVKSTTSLKNNSNTTYPLVGLAQQICPAAWAESAKVSGDAPWLQKTAQVTVIHQKVDGIRDIRKTIVQLSMVSMVIYNFLLVDDCKALENPWQGNITKTCGRYLLGPKQTCSALFMDKI